MRMELFFEKKFSFGESNTVRVGLNTITREITLIIGDGFFFFRYSDEQWEKIFRTEYIANLDSTSLVGRSSYNLRNKYIRIKGGSEWLVFTKKSVIVKKKSESIIFSKKSWVNLMIIANHIDVYIAVLRKWAFPFEIIYQRVLKDKRELNRANDTSVDVFTRFFLSEIQSEKWNL